MSHCLFPINLGAKYFRLITSKVLPRRFFLAFILSCIFSSHISYAAKTNELTEKNRQLLMVCQSCHGENLSGQEKFNAPALAGQFQSYLTKQIKNYQQGLRGTGKKDIAGQQMVNIALTLTNPDTLLALNQYLSRLPFIPKTRSNMPLNASQHSVDDNKNAAMQLRQGSNYYQGKCGACHGGNAQGNEKMFAPRLNNLSASYLTRQMANFSQGRRGNHPDDKYGRQMAMMAKTTAGQELNNIIMYINSVGMKASIGDGSE